MCLLLNYPLANLHVATERAVDECGEMINHHFSQFRGGCQENEKKKKCPFSCYPCEALTTEKQASPQKMCLAFYRKTRKRLRVNIVRLFTNYLM